MNVLVERPLLSTLSLTLVSFGVFIGGSLGAGVGQIVFHTILSILYPSPF